MLKVFLFGNFSILFNETPVNEFNTPRLQSLLAYLMLNSDAPQPRSHIAFLFWPETSEHQARTNLRNLYYHLKHALPDADAYIRADVQTLQWLPCTSFYLDVNDFLNQLRQADLSHSPDAQEGLEKAIPIYKGDLLPSCFDEWIIPLREELRQAYLNASVCLIDLLQEQRKYPAAIRHARRLLQFDPLQEVTYRSLMQLYALIGDRAGALRIYHSCVSTMQRELEVEPSTPTQELYKKLLGIDSPPAPSISVKSLLPHTVGRAEEWNCLLKVWRNISSGSDSHVVMLAGEAGIGKTRILEDMLQWANRQGITTAYTRCYAAEGELAFSPIVTWLRAYPLPPLDDICLAEVARLMPEILVQHPNLPRPVALTERWQRERFFEALSRAILGMPQPMLLTIDDLQWCDKDTLEWLHYLLRYDPRARFLVLGSYRPEEIGEFHPLMTLLQSLRNNDRVSEIELGPLDQDDTYLLAKQLAGEKMNQETSRQLYQQTEGNPLFIVETIRSGLSAFKPPSNYSYHWTNPKGETFSEILRMPPKVQSILETRLAQLSPASKELAGIAAVIGREFNFNILARISELADDILVHQLDELWRHRIIREHGAESYDFNHDRLRDVAYNNMSATRRRVLHLRVAQSLLAYHGTNLAPVSHQIATHYEQAGEIEKAIPFYQYAAEIARQVFANEEAIRLLNRGIGLMSELHPDTRNRDDINKVSGELWESLGDLLELTAQHEQALRSYQIALSSISIGEVWQARLHRKMAVVYKEQRSYTDALANCHLAEAALTKKPNQEDNAWWDEWLDVQVEKAWTHYWKADWFEMDTLISKMRPVIQSRGKTADRLRLLWISCLTNLRKGRYNVSDQMLSDSYEALAASQEWGDFKYIVNCQFEIGFLLLWKRELGKAEENLLKALELVEKSGILPIQVLCLTYLTVLYRFMGMEANVEKYAVLAQKIAKKAQMPDYIAAAKGNQSWLAWRRGNWAVAENQGREAIEIWKQSPLVYPFQWQALWPLIAISSRQGKMMEIKDFAQKLVEQNQQRLPEHLTAVLEIAARGDPVNQQDYLSHGLERIFEVAAEMGYL